MDSWGSYSSAYCSSPVHCKRGDSLALHSSLIKSTANPITQMTMGMNAGGELVPAKNDLIFMEQTPTSENVDWWPHTGGNDMWTGY